jgi:hypothetical protein
MKQRSSRSAAHITAGIFRLEKELFILPAARLYCKMPYSPGVKPQTAPLESRYKLGQDP